MDLAGKHAIVVGGGSGLGAAIAARLSFEGARLVLVDRDRAGLERQTARIRDCTVICGDATDQLTIGRAVDAAREPDVLIHTAAIDPLSATDVPGTSLQDWNDIIAVNLTSAFLFARAVLPGMVQRNSGCLLFTGSIAGLKPTPQEAAYAVSKAGVIQLARAIALDHARHGIRANALCPGFLESVMADRKLLMTAADLADRAQAARSLVPLGREGSYDELARLAVNLCDEAVSGYITGQAIVADGGFMLA